MINHGRDKSGLYRKTKFEEMAMQYNKATRRFFFPTILLIAALLVSTTIAMLPNLSNRAQAATRLTRLPSLANGVAQTPPMGWSSWNPYFANINESVIEASADAVVSSG